MKAETEIKVGDRVMVQKQGFYQMHNAMHDRDGREIPGTGARRSTRPSRGRAGSWWR